ncbi:anti-sigma factor%2C putative%2C ChrR family [Bordetella pertussis]|uniref:ChrR-like cupin domain-containing protein n=4 Tax=Bordetella pertussis TaxID=520 RepID=Q7VVP2_BORPE|nr:cupin domain-containing protein [Bordetella pertussis]KCV17008.1 ChrR cupin-like domain protein [Bordetella pertussis B200]KCV29358.1 ChrR cupin-like domain protein [Bordetella pertussis H934]AEE67837.1 hypothetical protein BPTD_2563 [Bordetella pertussis CS]AIW91694.1 hypothetical protein B1917_1250 [Bordetella pertussis B1917]AIW96391.1 hypothetical protein B1920_2615 [Bordetella pertussis B1920]
MLVNADFSLRATVSPRQYQWVASPQPGVERVMLDRWGGEKGRATSIVRYAPGACFPRHEHPGGEEILVLAGSFSEEGGRYPAGWYLRNPPGSSHAPYSAEGAVIFVKLRHMRPDDSRRVRVDSRDAAGWRVEDGRAACVLVSDRDEQVSMVRLPPGAGVFADAVEGAEMLVLEGGLAEGAREHGQGTWIRLPAGCHAGFCAARDGALVYLRTGPWAGQAVDQGQAC